MCVHDYLIFLPRLSQLPKPSTCILLLQRRLVFSQHLDARQKLALIGFHGIQGTLGWLWKWSLSQGTACFSWFNAFVSLFLSLWCGCLSPDIQLQNSLKTDLCLDQGPDTENVPIVYICHGMTPQVSAGSVWGEERKVKSGHSGPRGLGDFSLGNILMSKRESYLPWQESVWRNRILWDGEQGRWYIFKEKPLAPSRRPWVNYRLHSGSHSFP